VLAFAGECLRPPHSHEIRYDHPMQELRDRLTSLRDRIAHVMVRL
jgi:hypothetical protein